MTLHTTCGWIALALLSACSGTNATGIVDGGLSDSGGSTSSSPGSSGGSSSTPTSGATFGSSSTSTFNFGGSSSTSDSTATGSTASTTTSSSSSSTSSSSSSTSTGPAGTCDWNGGPTDSGQGELTCYWFSQGTSQMNGMYKTACGYFGTESGNPNGGGCGQTSFTDNVQNIANPTYFAAYKDNSSNAPSYCGLCAQINYGGKTIIATIVDDCATCDDTGHLDLSMSAANALGLTSGTGDPRSGVTWSSVSCDVTGDIVGLYNGGYSGQIYFQNVVFPVVSATAGGHTGNMNYGYWDFGTAVAGQSVTLKDALGHTVTGTIPGNSGGSTGTQFPATCE